MRIRTLTVATAAALALTAAACGGSDGTDATDCVDLTADGDTFTIRMLGNEFESSCFTASVSQGMTLVNEDPALHSFTLRDTPIDVDVRGGDSMDLDPIAGAVEPGTYELICKYHLPGMTGEVTIVE